MAEQDDLDSNFRSGIPYKYKFTLTKREDGDIYKGFSPTLVAHGNPNDPHGATNDCGSSKIHAIHLQNDTQVSNYSRFAKSSNQTFKPFLNLKPKDENLGNTTIGVGRFIGVPLLQWMSDKKKNGWEYDRHGNYLRPGSDWRDVGRWLGGPLYREHCSSRFVGNLLHSTFVDEGAKSVVFVKDPACQATLTTELGIQDDLNELRNLVRWLETSFPINNLTATPPDLAIFYDFYANLSANIRNIGDLMVLSYFMCHNFLWYDVDQRFKFCKVYRRIRKWHHFRTVDLSSSVNFISDFWNNSLPSNGPFEAVYDHEKVAHVSKYGLIHFHRSCEEHYNDNAHKKRLPTLSREQIDKKLVQMFPHAIPRVFNALCQSSISKLSLIDSLKKAGIHYT